MSVQQAFEPQGRAARAAPRWFVAAAASVPLGILGQFLLAGLSLFVDAGTWEMHGALGSSLLLPIAAVAVGPRIKREIRPLRHWGGALAALYVLQVAFIIAAENLGSGLSQALHVFNAGLLLISALVIVAKIEHSHRG